MACTGVGLSLRYNRIFLYRHPTADDRPTFSEITQGLLKSDFHLLKWSEEDISTHSKEVRTLGARLQLGRALYTELQRTYLTK